MDGVRFYTGKRCVKRVWPMYGSDAYIVLGKACGSNASRLVLLSNGAVESFHRCLRAALMARSNQGTWVGELHIVLLGLRAAHRSDTGVSAAELAFEMIYEWRTLGDYDRGYKDIIKIEDEDLYNKDWSKLQCQQVSRYITRCSVIFAAYYGPGRNERPLLPPKGLGLGASGKKKKKNAAAGAAVMAIVERSAWNEHRPAVQR
ncbi:hypothetical protein ACJJTC_017852 [Scirpophaga incertulas]